MARDITVHFVGNARDLAASSAVAEASVDRFGNATVRAGAQAEAASLGFSSLLVPLIALAAALVVATAPITVLATTFGGLAAGVVALAGFTGYLNDELDGLIAQARATASVLGAQAAPMASQFLITLRDLIPTVADFASQLMTWFAQRLPVMLPIITQIAQGLVAIILALAAAWGAMVDWFMAHWQQYSTAIGSVFSAIGTGVHFALPLLGLMGAAFQALGPVIQFVRDHADSLKPVLYALGAIIIVVVAVLALFVASCVVAAGVITALAAGISFAISHIYAIADAFWAVVHAAQAAAGAIGRARDAVASIPVIGGALHFAGVPGFAGGGVVPGPIGAPMLAMVHGGETVIPAGGGGGGGSTYNINVSVSPLASPADVGRQVVQAIQEYERRGSKAWRQ